MYDLTDQMNDQREQIATKLLNPIKVARKWGRRARTDIRRSNRCGSRRQSDARARDAGGEFSPPPSGCFCRPARGRVPRYLTLCAVVPQILTTRVLGLLSRS